MNRRISTVVFLFSLVTFVLVLCGPGAFADPDRDSYGEMPGKHGMMMGQGMMGMSAPMSTYFQKRLGLNDKQSEQMHKLYSDYKKEMVKKHADIRVAEMELTDLLEEKKIDMGAVDKAVKKAESLRSELTLYRIKALLQAKDFLTEEQFETFKDYTLGQMNHPMMYGPMPGHGMMGAPMPGMPGRMMPYYDDDYEDEDKKSGETGQQQMMPR